MSEVPKHLQSYNYEHPKKKKDSKLVREFKEYQKKKENISSNSEKNQANREISRLKAQSKKGGIAHKGNIEHSIKLRKEKHKIK